jgi:serine/threonine protein kinase/Tol biopolymer transport system component
MESKRWEHIEDIFHGALLCALADREAYLTSACGGDTNLQEEVESLISAYELPGDFLEQDQLSAGLNLYAAGDSPSLAGELIGPYVLESRIGRGGMGDVYLARDERLGRHIALKVLPSSIGNDAEWIARFRQEARAASSISHPNIAHIYEVGEFTGQQYIAMEYIEGINLRERMKRDCMELDEAVDIGLQVARGLAAAHAVGVLHRDVKPENIMLRLDGYVKVLDFGLAKIDVESRYTRREGFVDDINETEPGVIRGTARYMSPEQARGLKSDARTDIWSLGVVLYEMLCGEPPFTGETGGDVLAEILKSEPTRLAGEDSLLSPAIKTMLRRALSKDRGGRYQSVKELLQDLQTLGQSEHANASVIGHRRSDYPVEGLSDENKDPFAEPHFSESVPTRGSRFVATAQQISVAETGRPKERHIRVADENKDKRRDEAVVGLAVEDKSEPPAVIPRLGVLQLLDVSQRIRGISALTLVAILLLVVSLASMMFRLARQSRRALAPGGKNVVKLTSNGKTGAGVLSPDGRYLAYGSMDTGGLSSVWLRDLKGNTESQLLPPNEKSYGGLVFSIDGRTLYFTGPGDTNMNEFLQSPLFKVRISDKSVQKITIGVNSPITLSPDGRRIAFVRLNPTLKEAMLILANEDGSDERSLATVRRPSVFYFPSWSPDGKLIALGQRTLDAEGYYGSAIAVHVDGGEVETLTQQRWKELVAVKWLGNGTGILAMAVDRQGEPMQVWEISYPGGKARNVTEDANDYVYYALSVTADSSQMLLLKNTINSGIWLTQESPSEVPRRLSSDPGDGFNGISWTPDGKILYTSRSPDKWDIWEMDAGGGGRTRLTVNAGNNYYPSASRDGRYIVFTSDRGGRFNVWRMERDGGNATQLTHGIFDDFPYLTPDGKWVIYRSRDLDTPKVWKVPTSSGESVELIDKSQYPPAVSPDGQLIASFYTHGDLRGLAVIPTMGGEPLKTFDVLPSPTDPDNPFSQVIRWTADGGAVSYMDHQRGVSNIWQQPLAGGAPQQVTNFAANRIFFFDWSADGRQLALSRGEFVQDMMLVSNFR